MIITEKKYEVEIGNPLTIGNDITLRWINGRQLSKYINSNNIIDYKYNKDGIRTSKILNNIKTKYYLEGKKIILEKTENNVLYEKIIFWILIIYGIFIICCKDIIFKEKSIGKRIFKLYIIDKKMILKVIQQYYFLEIL